MVASTLWVYTSGSHLASAVILLLCRVLVSIRDWSAWAQEVGRNFGWHHQTALGALALPRH